MGAGLRRSEIRQRRTRRAKRRRQKLRELRKAIQRGRTHADRVRLAQEMAQKQRSA
jgi:hypothetical protein